MSNSGLITMARFNRNQKSINDLKPIFFNFPATLYRVRNNAMKIKNDDNPELFTKRRSMSDVCVCILYSKLRF